ncbi:DUF4340 domain-containing protein [Anaeromyxobacter dehalogenans]|uniref:DUF4340 domain-containing protein n=1 Tax=Anaeromyxobacter dehalogenans TaxID=161493 RepID=UPI0002E6C512|nr:DUF4340 domain-containing protein [Anaeromyxobacter dehalogenans]
MSRRALLLLALVLAVLAGAIALIATTGVRLRGRERAAGGTRGGAVVGVAPGQVIAIDVSAGGRAVRVVRRGGGWARAGDGAAVDQAAVADLLESAAALRRRATLGGSGEEGGVFDPYGLAAPRARLELALEGGGAARLELGAGTGADGAAFVRAPDGQVVAVAADAATRVEAAIGRLLAPEGAPPAAPAPGPAPGPTAEPRPFRG